MSMRPRRRGALGITTDTLLDKLAMNDTRNGESDDASVRSASNAPEDACLNESDNESSCDHDLLAWRREHFIPLRKVELTRLLAAQADDDSQREAFVQFCTLLEAVFHHEYHQCLEALKRLYEPFNPDSVTRELLTLTEQQRKASIPELFERLVHLLQRANYRHLSRREIECVVGIASDWGIRLQVDFSRFDRLEVFVCGDTVEQRTRRHWRNLYRPEAITVALYQRLVLIFRLRETDEPGDNTDDTDRRWVYIKMFKNIPKQDVDMLLPGSRFKMTPLDFCRVMLPTLSGLAIIIFRIFQGALLLVFAGVYGMLAFLGLVGGTLGYAFRSVLGYLRTKDKYRLVLTRRLYYQNLDNNAGVFFRLLDDAEEQEFREAVLAYALLDRRARPDGWDADRLDREAEAWLSGILDFPVDFEVHDALAKLQRLGCATSTPDGRWQALPLPQVIAALTQRWKDLFQQPPELPADRTVS
jgi:hypothetical protein